MTCVTSQGQKKKKDKKDQNNYSEISQHKWVLHSLATLQKVILEIFFVNKKIKIIIDAFLCIKKINFVYKLEFTNVTIYSLASYKQASNNKL